MTVQIINNVTIKDCEDEDIAMSKSKFKITVSNVALQPDLLGSVGNVKTGNLWDGFDDETLSVKMTLIPGNNFTLFTDDNGILVGCEKAVSFGGYYTNPTYKVSYADGLGYSEFNIELEDGPWILKFGSETDVLNFIGSDLCQFATLRITNDTTGTNYNFEPWKFNSGVRGVQLYVAKNMVYEGEKIYYKH